MYSHFCMAVTKCDNGSKIGLDITSRNCTLNDETNNEINKAIACSSEMFLL